MLTIRKILCTTDFSDCANQAVDYGIFLAHELGADLHLLHAVVLHADHAVDPLSHFPAPEEIYDKVRRIAEAEMAAHLESHRDGPFSIREVVRRGFDPAVVVLNYAADQDVDLIVQGTHGRRGIKRFLLGSVAEDVIRQTSRPVLTVPERTTPWKPKPIQTIVAPIDFSESSERSLRVAVKLARGHDAKVYLLHVVPDAVGADFKGFHAAEALLELQVAVEAESCQRLEKLGREVGIDVTWEAKTVVGHPAQTIASHAAKIDADLIVMATHGRSGLDRTLLGSTVDKVLRLAGCGVLTINADGESATEP